MTIRFSNQLVAELIQPFWAAWQVGEFMTDASAVAGTYRQRGLAWVRQAGGVRPRRGRGGRGVTCPLVSEKRLHSVVLGVSRSAPAPSSHLPADSSGGCALGHGPITIDHDRRNALIDAAPEHPHADVL